MGSFLIAAAALKTPTRNGYNAQGVNLKFWGEWHMYRKGDVLYQLSHVSSKRLEETWHIWYSTSPFLYKTATIWGSTPGRRKWCA